jgi:hypothetical protein
MAYTLANFLSALKPAGKLAADIGGRGVTGSPAYLKLPATDGTANYLFFETDGTLKRHTAVPTQDSDGTVVGGQS